MLEEKETTKEKSENKILLFKGTSSMKEETIQLFLTRIEKDMVFQNESGVLFSKFLFLPLWNKEEKFYPKKCLKKKLAQSISTSIYIPVFPLPLNSSFFRKKRTRFQSVLSVLSFFHKKFPQLPDPYLSRVFWNKTIYQQELSDGSSLSSFFYFVGCQFVEPLYNPCGVAVVVDLNYQQSKMEFLLMSSITKLCFTPDSAQIMWQDIPKMEVPRQIILLKVFYPICEIFEKASFDTVVSNNAIVWIRKNASIRTLSFAGELCDFFRLEKIVILIEEGSTLIHKPLFAHIYSCSRS